MEALSLPDVLAIVQKEAFKSWYKEYQAWHQAREGYRKLSVRSVEDRFFLAGEYEEKAARATEDYLSLDSDFETLATYETLRQRTADALLAMHGAEADLEQERRAASDLKARVEAANKQGASNSNDLHKLQRELEQAEAKIEIALLRLQSCVETLRQESKAKDAMWTQVERAWSAAFRANLARTEYQFLALALRPEHFSVIPPASASDEAQNAEAGALYEQQLAQLVAKAQAQFGCVCIEEFLYWPSRDDSDMVYCVPLISNNSTFNVQLEACSVYQIKADKGLEFIEPVPHDRESHEDQRLTDFFAATSMPRKRFASAFFNQPKRPQ